MKRFVLDKLILLVTDIGLMIVIPFLWRPAFAVFAEICVMAYGWTFYRFILLLPLDIIMGKVCCEAYFAAPVQLLENIILPNTYCTEWKFYHKDNPFDPVILLVPKEGKKEEVIQMEKPKKNTKLRITYYRFSKILLGYEEA